MGYVFRRGAKWYLKWQDASGRRRRQATKATTAREARELLAELEAQTSRVKLGLEALPVRSRETLQQLCEWWLAERCPEASRDNEGRRLAKHVFAHELGRLPLQQVTADAIEARLEAAEKAGGRKGRGLAPATINRLRTSLYSVFSAASEPPRRWTGENPVAATRLRQVQKHPAVTLTYEQLQQVLPHVPPAWRGVMVVAAYLGLRRGEIFALKKADYDPVRQQLQVAGSHQRRTTKGGRIDVLPVPTVVQPYLAEALKAPSLWLFPGRKGQQRTREADPHLVLRTAVRAAGIVDHWESWCRRCKGRGRKPVVVVSDTKPPEGAACPKCAMKLWVRAVPPHIRFHDLRHSAATNLLKAGAPLAYVQRIMRHASIQTTVNIYGHLVTEDLRGVLEAASAVSSRDGAASVTNSAPNRPHAALNRLSKEAGR